MTAYSVFPRQEQPMDQPAGPRAQSRFVEGSMNDRTSNAPPVDFLGPDEIAAYERQFYLDKSSTSGSKMRPVSTNGSVALSTSSKRSSFFSAVRERFSMSRTKSSSSIMTKSSMPVREEQPPLPRHHSMAETPAVTTTTTLDHYPSREEVMQNYKSLVEAGFFSSHAIQGTRHLPPSPVAAAGTTVAAAPSQQRMEAPLPESPTPNTQGLPFSKPVRVLTKRPETARPFASIPYSATRPTATGDPPKTTYPMPDPRPPLLGLSRTSQKENDYNLMPPPPSPGPSSPQRGTKRGMADMAGGATEREMMNGSTEGNARRLVKKLRKSASRVSADLARPLTSAGTTTDSNGGLTRNSVFGRSSVSLASEAGSTGGSGSRAMGLVRSLSSTFKRDGANKATTTPNPDVILPDTTASLPKTPTTPTKRLSKARKAPGRRASVSRPSSSSRSTVSSHPPVSFNPNRLPTTIATDQPPVLPHLELGTSASLPPSPTKTDADAMVIDLPSPPPRQSVEVPMSGLSVPSFHYPQRQRPLAVVPDLNRGLPDLQPLQFAGRYGKTDGFCFGIPIVGEKENGDCFGEREREIDEV